MKSAKELRAMIKMKQIQEENQALEHVMELMVECATHGQDYCSFEAERHLKIIQIKEKTLHELGYKVSYNLDRSKILIQWSEDDD